MKVVRLSASGVRGLGFSFLALACAALVACATEADDTGQTLGGPEGGSGASPTTAAAADMSPGGTSGSGPGSVATGGAGAGAGGAAAGASATGGGAAAGGGVGGAAAGSGGVAGGAGTGGAAGTDTCPTDPKKMAPGKCGCDVPDEDSIDGVSCVPLQNSIVHRYSFEQDTKDSVGSAHGTLMGGATFSGGALVLEGGSSGQYLNLPNHLINGLKDLTIEAYVTWTGSAGKDWQRIFDFGVTDMGEDAAGDGATYLFLSARAFRACYQGRTPKAEVFVDSNAPLAADSVQVAVVVNNTAQKLELYVNGTNRGFTALDQPLSAIDDVNNWLGRSQYKSDEYFAGKISEFRIYNAALTGPQLLTAKLMGENTTYLKK